jgi:hypothetical protein
MGIVVVDRLVLSATTMAPVLEATMCSLKVGVFVPMPILPLFWNRREFPSVVVLVHMGMVLIVPEPPTCA